VAKLGEVSVEQRRAATQRRLALGQNDLATAFGRLQRRRHTADATAAKMHGEPFLRSCRQVPAVSPAAVILLKIANLELELRQVGKHYLRPEMPDG
jgi:hypothetical protein